MRDKDESKTNGVYQIRQIIIKIMEYIHIHPWAKWNQSSKNKVQYIDLVNKGNQKLYLPIKNNTNLSTNSKTKLKVGNKEMKTKLTNMLRGKERKKRKNMQS